MHARAWCEIDLDALRHNAHQLRERAGAPLVAMVKADAYGLGAEAVARALGAEFDDGPGDAPGERATRPDGPWGLGVATVAEGEALRAAGCRSRLLCCTPLLPEALPAAALAGIIPSLHRPADIAQWRALGTAPWHLIIDTGMHRAGVDWRQVESVREVVAEHPPQGVFTHFHSADAADGSRVAQELRFEQAVAALGLPSDVLRHIDASLSLHVRAPAARGLARPGIALYGSPSVGVLGLQPVAHVYARVIELRDVPTGETVSYGATWTASRPSRIATVAIGHADGYRRAFSNVGRMLVSGSPAPVAGTVAMDMTMLDVTDVPCALGDVVTVLGRAWVPSPDAATPETPTITIDALAAQGGISSYELLVGWRLRLPRVYRGAQ